MFPARHVRNVAQVGEAGMDQADLIGVTEVRSAILAFGEPRFTADDIADELNVDGVPAMKAVWKVLGYMTGLDEIRKEEGKPTRWKVIRLNTAGKTPKHEGTALFGAMLGWKV